MKVLTIEQQKSYENAKFYYICKENFEDKHAKDEKHHRVRDHCYYTWKYRSAEHSICNLKYSVPEEIPIVFCDGSKYDYHFIMKELAEEFEENTGKNITFSVLIEKEVIRIDKKGKDIIKTESYRLQFIDYGKLPNLHLLIILLKEFTKLNLNADAMIKNVKLGALFAKIETAFLNTQMFVL